MNTKKILVLLLCIVLAGCVFALVACEKLSVCNDGREFELNEDGKSGSASCHTFLDDIVGAIAAAASTRVAQIWSEDEAARRNNN